MRQSIRRYIFSRLALVFSIVIVLVTAISIGFYYKASVNFYHEKYSEQIDNFEWVMSQWLDSGKMELSYLRDNYKSAQLSLDEQYQPLRTLWRSKQSRFDYVFVTDKTGQYMTSLSPQSKNVSDRTYYQKAMKGETYVSEMITSRLTHNDMFVIAMPLLAADKSKEGIFAGSIEMHNLTAQMSQFALGDANVKVYIVDRYGKIASVIQQGNAHAADGHIGQGIDELLKTNASQLTDDDRKEVGNKFIMNRSIQGSNGWHTVFVVDETPLYQNMMLQLLAILVVAVALLFIVSQLSHGIARAIVDPIHALITSFGDMGRGKPEGERPQFQIMELGLLYNAYHDSRQALYDLSYIDSLTGLTNLTFFKRWLQDRLDQEKATLMNDTILLIMEIDHFKVINDTFGFRGGDFVIKAIAKWLEGQTDITNSSKMNGDEFAGLLQNEMGVLRAYELRDQLNAYLSEGIIFEGTCIHVSVSFGVSHFYEDDTEAETCFQNAYIALNEAKKQTVAGLEVFNQRLKSEVTRRVLLEMSMRHALDEGEMYPVYQPIIANEAGKTTFAGVEALIRWESPSLGFVPPGEFIPIAENSKFIVTLGRWMIDKTFNDLRDMKLKYGQALYLSLNAASAEFEEADFADYLIEKIHDFGHKPEDVVVELTERVMMDDKPEVTSNVEKLVNYGIRLSLDDFGTGYSSLSYLLKYPFSVVKIDRSFIVNGHQKSAQDLLEVMRLIAEKYELKTVAEGVETEAHAEMVKQIGFDFSQGYYFSRPFKLEALPNFLESDKIVPLYTAENGIYNRHD